MLNFGSGRAFPQTLSQAAAFSPPAHALYGVWDWDMGAWNRRTTANGRSVLMRSLAVTGPDAPQGLTVQSTQLLDRALFTNGQAASVMSVGSRTVDQTPVCWRGGPLCNAGAAAPSWGWRVGLTGLQEQVIYNPVMDDGLWVVSTTIPAIAAPLSCSAPTVAAGFTMALSADQGLAATQSYFIDPLNPATGASAGSSTNASASTLGTNQLAGISLGGVGTPSFLTYHNIKYLVTQTASGALSLNRLAVKVDDPFTKRMTWRELR